MEWLDPDDAEYDAARRVWNAMHDRRPARIARCHETADVVAALRFARTAGLEISVRGGGHNVAGTALADGAVMIDLSPMRQVTVDPRRRVAYAQGGCLLADLDTATAAHGLVCPTGIISQTGLGGLALGGGYGWLSRRWGLTCDHILAAEVVLADGSVVMASPDSHPELLWALRGGGGNFGVVTRFTLRLREATRVTCRTGVWDLDRAPDALEAYRTFTGKLSPDLHVGGGFKVAGAYPGRDGWLPDRLRGRTVLSLTAVWFGPPEQAADAVAPLHEAVPPAATTGRVTTHVELQTMGDHERPAGNRYYTKSTYLDDLTAPVVEECLATARGIPSPLSSVQLEFLRGAVADIPEEDSAFPGRSAPYIYTVSSQWTDPASDRTHIDWTRDAVARLAPYSHGGAYVNYLQDEPHGKVAEVYGAARLARLAAVKATYDPDNVFHLNQNIPPAAADD
ncbi:FAD linked oxidase-like protein [Streptomyces cyaneogriseus subsp. noncyanogenus]|uniref:FAD linked oxidase-like protein n=1 Tax=Streptomyces cyaneogriseus subsp. noncyanogenus TaxID=477245 RepID=A0A0C5G6A0_9ACTN|nr:FAD-binding oxidoreductase [Streptomyces cyaneogriseus]AJP05523.1 FAD linked oxidase-like protein [Streptomyces cyaneogriseus subsp. noncyanogenus]